MPCTKNSKSKLELPQHTTYQQTTSDMRHSQYQSYENGPTYRQQYATSATPSHQAQYQRTPQNQSGIAFSHYQPPQGSYSRTSPLPPPGPSPQPWQTGYPPINGTSSRHASVPVSQFSQNSMYNGGRVASPYQVRNA